MTGKRKGVVAVVRNAATRHRRAFLSVVAVVVAGALYLVAASINGLTPFSSGSASSAGSASGSSASGAARQSGPGTTVPPTSPTDLTNLLPDQGCSTDPQAQIPGLVGLVDQSPLQCTNDPDLPSADIIGYQFDNVSDYDSGLQVLNNSIGFSASSAGDSCPPSGVANSGSTTWQSSDYQAQADQILECALTTVAGTPARPTYLWTIPSRFAVVEAVDTDPAATFADLQTWFENDAQP